MSRVIKGRGSGRVVRGAVFDARAEAERILEGARIEAQASLREARAEAQRIRETARDQGRDAGRAELVALRMEAIERRDASLRDAEAELLKLAIAAAERILRRQLELTPEAVREVVQGVLGRARRAKRGRLHVHPEDAALLRESLSTHEHIELREDPSLQRGGCVFESDLGTIDARLEVQLEELQRALMDGTP